MRIAEAAAEQSVPFLESLCRELDMTLVVGTIEPAGERYRNSAYIVGPGGYLATFTKLHIPNETERAWFEPGSQLPVVTSQGWTFGVGICYDLRFPEIFRTAAQEGADFFLLAVGASGCADNVTPDGDQTEQAAEHRQLGRPGPASKGRGQCALHFLRQSGGKERQRMVSRARLRDRSARSVHRRTRTRGRHDRDRGLERFNRESAIVRLLHSQRGQARSLRVTSDREWNPLAPPDTDCSAPPPRPLGW